MLKQLSIFNFIKEIIEALLWFIFAWIIIPVITIIIIALIVEYLFLIPIL